jgi:hypothetical protein
MIPAEHVQRQIAVVPVVAVKKRLSCFPCSGVSVASKSSTSSGGAYRCASRKMSTNRVSIASGEYPIL